MRICVPVDRDDGIDSVPSMSLESAPLFIIHDTGSGETEAVENTGCGQDEGGGDPLRTIRDLKFDVLITGNADNETIAALAAKGVKAYRAMPGTIAGNLEVLKMGSLDELTPGLAEE